MGAFQLDDLACQRPEVAGLSDTAFRLWISLLSWQAEYEHDGLCVAYGLARMLYGRRHKRLVTELIDAGLLEPIDGDASWAMLAREVRGFTLWRNGPVARRRTHIHQALRQYVFQRDGFACLHCGATEKLSLDHIHPWSRGGEDTASNLQTLCRSCNSRKGAKV